MARKWTVRVPDETADAFGDFCRVNGVTVQGCLTAAVLLVNELHETHGGVAVEQWPEPFAFTAPRGQLLAVARELDAERRRRT